LYSLHFSGGSGYVLVCKQGEITMPVKTKLLLKYQYLGKDGESKYTKHHLQDVSIKKITLFANKISS